MSKQELVSQTNVAPQHLVTDMAQVKSIMDPVRMTLLEMLAEREYTSRDLAGELSISQQLTYHHLQKLIEAGLVQITHAGRRGNLEIYYYRAVVQCFEFNLPAINKAAIQEEVDRHVLEDRVLEERDLETAEVLEKMGFKLQSTPQFAEWAKEEASFFVESYHALMTKLGTDDLGQPQWESAVAALRIATLASMDETKLDAWFESVRKVRKIVQPAQ